MKRGKWIALALCAILCFGIFAGCAGDPAVPGPDLPPADTPEDPDKTKPDGPGTPQGGETVSPWTKEPEVKSVFYSDFGRDDDVTAKWSCVNYGWGQNGVTAANVGFTRSPAVVRGMGASGGVVVLNSYGNYYKDAGKRGQGAVLISKQLFGPGKYEVRMRVVPRFGPCSTAWSYYTNSGAIETPNGLVYGHNTSDKIAYHEIDIECPRIGEGFNGWGGVAYEEYYQDSNNLGQDGLGKVVNHSTAAPVMAEAPYNDGQWHTFAFEWRTTAYAYDASKGENEGAVIWYMDGKEVARTAKNTPYYPDQLWVGNWYPDNSTDWLGVADFDEAYMYLDWVRITEYTDEVRTKQPSGAAIAPDLNGCNTFLTSQGGNKDWGAKIPVNNYISNGSFALADKAEGALGWTGGEKTDEGLSVTEKAYQEIAAQYEGYAFSLEATAFAAEGSGTMYIEYLRGEYPERSNDNRKMQATVLGTSEKVVFGAESTKTLEFTLPEGANNFRVVFEAENGARLVVKQAKLYLKSDMNLL